jgi:hypothetical protein
MFFQVNITCTITFSDPTTSRLRMEQADFFVCCLQHLGNGGLFFE